MNWADPYAGMEQRARELARIAHRGQERWSGPRDNPACCEPYWHHPQRVARVLDQHDMPVYVVAAGWLHDVMEDCEVRSWQIDLFMGVPTVSSLVQDVTNVSKPTDGNRAARMALDREHLSRASFFGAQIKCSDILDNTTTPFPANKMGFGFKYFEEKKLELEILHDILNRKVAPDLRIWKLAWMAYKEGPKLWTPA